MTQRPSGVRPQLTVPDQAGSTRLRLLHLRPIREPSVQVWPAATFPPLRVQLAHPAARGTVTALGDLAALVRPLLGPAWVRGQGELFHVGAPLLLPAQEVTLTQSAATSMSPTARHLHAPPPNTGSSGSKTSTSARNSGRTTAISLPTPKSLPAS